MIEAREISKIYNNEVVIENFSMEAQLGEFISLTGESGSGKTTILNMLGLLVKPDGGEIYVAGIKNPNQKQALQLHRHTFGFLFQNYALMENETVAENLKIALEFQKKIDHNSKMKEALEFVKLRGVLDKKVYQLSGGEQQRVALARLFIKEAKYILADEPTGNLDVKNRDIVFSLLKELNELGRTVIYVTHDLELANKADRQIQI